MDTVYANVNSLHSDDIVHKMHLIVTHAEPTVRFRPQRVGAIAQLIRNAVVLRSFPPLLHLRVTNPARNFATSSDLLRSRATCCCDTLKVTGSPTQKEPAHTVKMAYKILTV